MGSPVQEFFQRLASIGLYGYAQPCQFVRDDVLGLDVVPREFGPESRMIRKQLRKDGKRTR